MTATESGEGEMIAYYGLDGEPITLEEWVALFDNPKRLLAQDVLPDGEYVSTVWSGLDHGYGDGPPLIFETMTFTSTTGGEEMDVRRYSTREQAMEGHLEMVRKHGATP